MAASSWGCIDDLVPIFIGWINKWLFYNIYVWMLVVICNLFKWDWGLFFSSSLLLGKYALNILWKFVAQSSLIYGFGGHK